MGTFVLMSLLFLAVSPAVEGQSAMSAAVATNTLKAALPTPNKAVDIIFALDRSGSVGSSNYNKIIDFVKAVLSHFSVSPTTTRVAVVSFGTDAKVEFDLLRWTSNNNNKCELLRTYIPKLKYTGGGTNTIGALNLALALLKKPGVRSTSTKVVFTITEIRLLGLWEVQSLFASHQELRAFWKATEDEISRIQAEIDDIFEKGDKAIKETDDSTKKEQIRLKLNDLKGRWSSVKDDAELKKKTLRTVVPQWYQFRSQTDDLNMYLTEIEIRIREAKDDPSKLQAIHEELQHKQEDLDRLNRRAEELKQQGAKPVVEPQLIHINRRWKDIENQFQQYHRPVQFSTVTTETITTENVSMVSVTSMRSAGEGRPSASDFLAEINKILFHIADIELQLASPELNAGDYEDFSKQEDKLKIENQFQQYHRPVQFSTVTTETITTENVSMVSVTSMRSAGEGRPSASDFLAEINKILFHIADIELQLASPELNAGDYEDFSKQEDKLKGWQTVCASRMVIVKIRHPPGLGFVWRNEGTSSADNAGMLVDIGAGYDRCQNHTLGEDAPSRCSDNTLKEAACDGRNGPSIDFVVSILMAEDEGVVL
uniref:VWFA domain-containing protein n=1 Tax=Branchiostoma floridae TaxID=7739 RepID=C3YXT4_BRAFL|eukprot:XP_002598881.1 hypothetical protein BRAFLDRAFT_90093 [Branchiostoma floridae]